MEVCVGFRRIDFFGVWVEFDGFCIDDEFYFDCWTDGKYIYSKDNKTKYSFKMSNSESKEDSDELNDFLRSRSNEAQSPSFYKSMSLREKPEKSYFQIPSEVKRDSSFTYGLGSNNLSRGRLTLVFAFASPLTFKKSEESQETKIQLLNHKKEFEIIDDTLSVS